MRFESKFGIGEICVHDPFKHREKEGKAPRDLLVKVVSISFDSRGAVYICENILTNGHVEFISCHESDLEGDPDFDQEKGRYLEG